LNASSCVITPDITYSSCKNYKPVGDVVRSLLTAGT